jgi:hypothetical protein
MPSSLSTSAVLPGVDQADQMSFLPCVELGPAAAQPALGLGDSHPLLGPQPDEVGLDLQHPQYIGDKRVQTDLLIEQVCALAKSGLRGREHAMPDRPQWLSDPPPAPAAVEEPMN